MLKALSPDRLAQFAVRRPWTVVAAWSVFLVLALVAAASIGGVLTTEAETYRESDSSRAEDLLIERFYGAEPMQETVVLHSANGTIDEPALSNAAKTVIDGLRALPGLQVVSYFDTQAPELLSESRASLLVPVNILEGVNGRDGITAATGGEGSIALAFNETSEKDLQTAEIIGLPIALVILVVVFGTLVAAGIPLLLGILSIIVAVGITAIIGRGFELSIFVVNIITTMGLAVGIDYSLLVVQRFREERNRGLSRDAAIEKAG